MTRMPAARCPTAEVVIDFSSATALDVLARRLPPRKRPLVIGTTGHTPEQRVAINERGAGNSNRVYAANFSVGVNALFWLTRQAAQILGPDFDLEVSRDAPSAQKDAPSGTARRLAEILAEVRGLDYGADARHGREGIVGARGEREIGVHAVRGGDVVGEHTVLFRGCGRTDRTDPSGVEPGNLRPRARLRAAAWVRGQPPGLYDMEDVLGLRIAPPYPCADNPP